MKPGLTTLLNAPLRRGLLASAVVALFAFSGTPNSYAQSNSQDEKGWTVLEYDADGNVIGVQQGEGQHPVGDEAIEGLGPDGQPIDNNGLNGAGRADDPNEFDKEYIEGEVMIADISNEQLDGLRADGFHLLERVHMDTLDTNLARLRIPSSMSVPEAVRYIRSKYPNLILDSHDLFDMSAGNTKSDKFGNDYARRVIGWSRVSNSCGRGMRIGMIDGDVDVAHKLLVDRNINFRNFVRGKKRPVAENHGTAVASMIVGRSTEAHIGGLLPGANLFAAGIFQQKGTREVGSLAAMLKAINWMAEEDVKVANMSIAGSKNRVMELIIKRARVKGVILVAAAGNKGPYAPPAWPAADQNVLAVTAIDKGLNIYASANQGDYVDFAAPGVDIDTFTPKGKLMQSGTSFATPFVTAVVALHIQAGFEADPDIMRQNLLKFTKDLGPRGRDPVYGAGVVRLRPNCK